MQVAAVDMFCGAGGLTYGLEEAGISVLRGFDTDRHSEYPYEANTDSTFRNLDVMSLKNDPEPIARIFPWDADLTVLAACAPCQPYSTMGNSRSGGTEDHKKWGLLQVFKRVVEYVEPDVVMTENVLQVRNDDTYLVFEETLQDLGYSLNPPANRNVYAPDCGVPQKRKRWVLLASKRGELTLPDPPITDEDEYPTVREAIGDLPPIEAGGVHPDDDLHRARTLSETNLKRIKNMEPGGDWTLWEERGLDHLLADCHTKESGRSYKAPYSRMEPDEPAPTITTQFYNYGSGRFGHYDTKQKRALSLREGACLQTFPSDYKFYNKWNKVGIKNVGRLIGNAVPPRIAEWAGEAVLKHVGAEPNTALAKSGDD